MHARREMLQIPAKEQYCQQLFFSCAHKTEFRTRKHCSMKDNVLKTINKRTGNTAIVEGPRDALRQLKYCQLLHNCLKIACEKVAIFIFIRQNGRDKYNNKKIIKSKRKIEANNLTQQI